MPMKRDRFFPITQNILIVWGQNIKIRRTDRMITVKQLANNAAVGRSTLYLIEQGSPTVAIGAYIQVLYALNMEMDLLEFGYSDIPRIKLREKDILVLWKRMLAEKCP
jgi:transcriptional regulator with XRE-family HTH domain